MLRRRRGALAALLAAAIGSFVGGARVNAADQSLKIPTKAPPPEFNPLTPPWSYGVMLGGNLAAHTRVDSTSGFYRGGHQGFAGGYGGLFVNIPVAATGPRGVPFQSWTWSITPAVDYMHSTSLNYRGTGGGFPVTGSGSMSQFDMLLMLKATTPLNRDNSLSLFGGLGGAVVRPRGNPTGPGGPAYTGNALVPAFRGGVELSQRLNGSMAVALQAIYQHTNGATFDTTLPGERFDVKGNDSFMLGLTLTVGDTPPTGPGPRGPVISQDTTPTYVTTEHKASKGRTVVGDGQCIKGGNCGAFIWNPVEGGNVTDSQRIGIYKSGLYVAATTKKPCDVVFYNDGSNENNSHVEFVTDVDDKGTVSTIGQDGGNRPITTGPMGSDGQVMTPNSPPAGGPSDADITAARQKVKNPKNLKDWEPFLKLCRERNKIDMSKFPKQGP
jgi:hypothetical protein